MASFIGNQCFLKLEMMLFALAAVVGDKQKLINFFIR